MLGTLSRFVYDLGLEPYGFVAWRAGIGAVATAGVTSSTVTQQRVASEWDRVGRNDPCPCGSGKKFKKCHGA